MTIKFSKVQSLLCDYIVLDENEPLPAAPELLARFLCGRRSAVGGEGLLLLGEKEAAPTYVRYFRDDGEELPPTEEALRALTAYLSLGRGYPDGTLFINFPMGERLFHIKRMPSGHICATNELPPPVFNPETVGIKRTSPLLGQKITVRGFSYSVYALSLGASSFVISFDFGTTLDRLRTAETGIPLCMHPLFCKSPTAVFVTQNSKNLFSLRLWEPHGGEMPADTDAAGAAFAVATLLGMCPVGQEISIRMRGGILTISTDSIGGRATVSANASYCFHGTVHLDNLTGQPH